jgi:hypothetical protein
MKKHAAVSLLFWASAAYDGLLGLAFLVGAGAIFEWAQVTPPNHLAYVQFPGALLITFAVMFAAVARKPLENRGLIPYGILLKLSYCAVAFYYWFTSGIPTLWKPFAIIDLACIPLLAWAYYATSSRTSADAGQRSPLSVQP